MILSIFEAFAFSHITKKKNTLLLFSGKTRGFRYGVKSDRCRFWVSFFRSRYMMIRACRIIPRKIVFSKKGPEEEVWFSYFYLDALVICYFNRFDLWCLYHRKNFFFPFWDKIGNQTQFWEINGFFFPILGNVLENHCENNFTEMGTFWELVMEYQLNHKFGKYFFRFPKVGKYLEKQQVFLPHSWEFVVKF